MNGSIEVVDAQATEALLPYPELAAEIGRTLEDVAAGRVRALERATTTLPGDGTFLLMGAADERLAIAKVGAVHPTNSARGLPTIIASVIVTDATNGAVRALLDGASVTVRRTAALSLYGAQQVGAKATNVFMVGAGAQAVGHLEALHAGLRIGNLHVTSRTAARAAEVVERANALGVSAAVVTDPAEALTRAAAADLIVTTTNSSTPVLPSELASRLRPEATIVAVGAYRHDLAEIPPAVVAACDVVVDTLEGARDEAGDLIQAAAAGVWSWQGARELKDLLGGFNRSGRPVLVKTVGHSMWDLAAARLAVPAG